MIRIKRGLNLPIAGAPEQAIAADKFNPSSVALLGRDYIGMKPTMAVAVGERVKLGQTLFSDKKNPEVKFNSPGAGVVSEINRGYQRRLLSVVVELEGDEAIEFASFPESELASISRQQVVENLLNSGLWTALRQRPFSKIPSPSVTPRNLFVNVMDTNPLAVNPNTVLADDLDSFTKGINVLAQLPEEKLFLCMSHRDPHDILGQDFHEKVTIQQFTGPHPSGLSGTHIHFLQPAGLGAEAWYMNYQDVIAVGKLFSTGRLDPERVISLAGPQVREPRIIRARVGANIHDLVLGELKPHESRVISGSVLAGAKAEGVEAYLGRYHLQVSVVREGRERPLLGYLSPGVNRHSVMGIYISNFYSSRRFPISTSTQGSERAMVPIGAYEKVMPLDILPTQLLRALIVGDIETAQNLGALELDEEDLALCSYVCPGKYEYGSILRDNLTRIEKEA